MEDKQKEILELSNILITFGIHPENNAKTIAEKLITAYNYKRISKSSIVLPNADYEADLYDKYREGVSVGYNNGKKDAAEKIVQMCKYSLSRGAKDWIAEEFKAEIK